MNTENNEKGFIFYEEPKKDKNPKKVVKIIAAIAIGLAMTLTGGLVGGLVTYKVLVKNGDGKVVELAPVSFKQGDGEALTIAEVYNKVKPAVVTISSKGTESYKGLFAQNVEGIGSGFIINEEGYILTNYHVVDLAISNNSKEVTVILSDGQEVKANVINYDKNKDIAMVKLADGTKVPAVAELGDSDALYVGQQVVAIGTPLGKNFAQTLTQGIVSGINRNLSMSNGETGNYIQTDTAINSGNSGGPLINTKGQVIGINTAKLSNQGQDATVEGMGFAIPINDAKERIGSLSKPVLTLGVTVRELDKTSAKQNDVPEGLWVSGVNENSPAEKAGIKPLDVIVKFDGKEIKTFDELTKIKETKKSGDKVDIVVYRNGKNVTLTLELAES